MNNGASVFEQEDVNRDGSESAHLGTSRVGTNGADAGPFPGTVAGKQSKNAKQTKNDEASRVARALDRFIFVRKSCDYYFREEDRWNKVNQTAISRILLTDYQIVNNDDGPFEDFFLRKVMKEKWADAAIDLAGYAKAGIVRDTLDRPVLITTPTPFIHPVDRPWPVLKRVLTGMFREQLPYLHSWIKWGLENLIDGGRKQGHYLILMGMRGCGKTLLQERILSPIFGCRPTDATKLFVEKSDFNGEWLSAYHLMISDGLALKGYQERKEYTERIKRYIANTEQRARHMYSPGIFVPYICRASCSMNEDAIDSLPLLEEGMKDKVLLLKGYAHRYVPSKGYMTQNQFEQTISQELPGYVHFLLNTWQIPSRMKGDTRFGFTAWQNPEILALQEDESRETSLAEILINYYTSAEAVSIAQVQVRQAPVEVNQTKLYEDLRKFSSSFCALCTGAQAFGHLLSDLEKATKAGKPICGVNIRKLPKSNNVRKLTIHLT